MRSMKRMGCGALLAAAMLLLPLLGPAFAQQQQCSNTGSYTCPPQAAGSIGEGQLQALKALNDAMGAPAAPSGSATAANQDTANTRLGATDESAAATDTSTSGLNGLLKRIAQRLTSLITALGAPMQSSGGTVGLVAGTAEFGKVSPTAVATATQANVSVAVAATSVIASNAARKPGSVVVNDSTAISYCGFWADTSTTKFYAAIDGKTTVPGIFPIPDGVTSAVYCYGAAATGTWRATEMQ